MPCVENGNCTTEIHKNNEIQDYVENLILKAVPDMLCYCTVFKPTAF